MKMKNILLKTFVIFATLYTLVQAKSIACDQSPTQLNDTNRIVFGNDIPSNEFIPYQVSLQYLSKSGEQKHFCGGSIISENRILTAGHCCDGINYRRMSVLAGIRTLKDTNGSRRRVTKCSMHESYQKSEFNDIAVISIEPPLNFSNSIQAIDVSNKGLVEGNVPVTLTGWGLRLPLELPFLPENYHTLNFPSTLQKLNYYTLSNAECQDQGMTDVSSKEICARRRTFVPQGACIGDSGGPLVMKTNDGLRQVGVVSYGFRVCGILPDVYTRVSMYTEWLKRRMA